MDSGCIPARSRRQAFDWSLVLASQSIETTIVQAEEQPHWRLLVSPADYERAMTSIRDFCLENPARSWQRQIPWSKEPFHLGAAPVCWLLALIHGLAGSILPQLMTQGTMDSPRALAGEWWRLFTAISLHADLAHLFSNLSLGFVFLGLAMARFGAGWALLASFLSGAMGNVLGLMLYPAPYRGLGASGMVMGALGLLATHSMVLLRGDPRAARYVLSGVLAGVFLFLLFGVDSASDVIGHVGGFAGGMLLGGILAWFPRRSLPRSNRWALLGVILLYVGTWALALIHH